MAFGRKLGNFTKGFLSTATPGVTRAFAAQGRREEVEKKQEFQRTEAEAGREFQRTEAKTEREFQKQIADSDQMLDMIYGATTAAELRDLEDVVASQYPQFIDQLAARRAGINAAKREGEEAEERKLLRSMLQAAIRTDPKAAEQIATDLGWNNFARLARDKNLNCAGITADDDLTAAELREQALEAYERKIFPDQSLEQILERFVNAHEATRQALRKMALSQPGTDLWSYEQTATPSEPGSSDPGWFETLGTVGAGAYGAHQGRQTAKRLLKTKPKASIKDLQGGKGPSWLRTLPFRLARNFPRTTHPVGMAVGAAAGLAASEGAGRVYDYLTGDEEATEPLPYEPE